MIEVNRDLIEVDREVIEVNLDLIEVKRNLIKVNRYMMKANRDTIEAIKSQFKLSQTTQALGLKVFSVLFLINSECQNIYLLKKINRLHGLFCLH